MAGAGGLSPANYQLVSCPPPRPELPTPLASDSFQRSDGALGVSDGLGHAWQGGAGLAWQTVRGAWTVSSGLARASGLDGGYAVCALETGAADLIAACAPTVNGAGSLGLALRVVDAANYVLCYVNAGNNVVLRKVLGGVLQPPLLAQTVTYTPGTELLVTGQGAEFAVYYGGLLVGATQISDSLFSGETRAGLWSNTAHALHGSARLVLWAGRGLAPVFSPGKAALISVYRQSREVLLITQRLRGAPLNQAVRWRLRRLSTPAAGWSFASGVWTVQRLSVVDLNAVEPERILIPDNPTQEYALLLGLAGDEAGDYGFTGGYAHGGELLTSLALTLDGAPLAELPVGVYACGRRLLVHQHIQTYLPKDKTSLAGAVSLRHQFVRDHLLVDHAHSFEQGLALYSFYSAMLTGSDAELGRYQVAGFAPADIANDDGIHQSGTPAAQVMFSASDHPYRLVLSLPDGGPDKNADWSRSGGLKTWVKDGADGTTKAYVTWISTVFAERQPAGYSSHRQRYQVVTV